MQTTELIARIIGPIYLIAAVAVFLNRDRLIEAAREITTSPGLNFLAALLALTVGTLIVAVHNVWTGWAALITLFGWIGIVKGAALLMFPAHYAKMSSQLIEKPLPAAALSGVALAIGCIFTYMGFIGPTS